MNFNGSEKIKIILYGIGAIGGEVAKFALSRSCLEVVGAIDSDPAKIGVDRRSLRLVKKSRNKSDWRR